MDPLEEKLQSLRLREPSADLDRRVLSHKPRSRSSLQRPVPLWFALAAAAAMAFFGFAAGMTMIEQPAPATISRTTDRPAVQVHVIMDPAEAAKMFDFTQRSVGFQNMEFTQLDNSDNQGV